ncbi:hypothetical protein [Prevotella intermedia]|uniref:hypothetical protein n=1 Tax=Prevotella intermedia TaxID=28131 RepID=UPI0012FD4228|nr:hypothetical protein [Prevotella intermedia]
MAKKKYTRRGDGFSEHFMSGIKAPIIKCLREDEELDFQYRGGYINIYYMGGNILKISGKSSLYFNEFYYYLPEKNDLRSSDIDKLLSKDYLSKVKESRNLCKLKLSNQEWENERKKAKNIVEENKKKRDKLIEKLKQSKTEEEVKEFIKGLKRQINEWKEKLTSNGWKGNTVDERTIQHYISLSNKVIIEGENDIRVLDLEYALSPNAIYAKENSKSQPRIDMIGIDKFGQVYAMELKYGKKAIGGNKASAKDHYDDFQKTIGADGKWEAFIEDIECLVNAKNKYEELEPQIKIKKEKPIFCYVFKNEEDTDEQEFKDYLKDKKLSNILTIFLPMDTREEGFISKKYQLKK